MKSFSATLSELSNVNGQLTAFFTCDRQLQFTPGQYIQISDPGSNEQLPENLFPISFSEDGKQFGVHINSSLVPGSSFQMRGMLGNGFSTGVSIRKLLLINLGNVNRIAPLLALMNSKNSANINMTLLTNEPVEGLPTKIEILPLSAFKEVETWPDAIAVTCDISTLDDLFRLFDKNKIRTHSLPVEACIHTPVLCAGIAECSLCSVLTKSGWKHACKDGPVFRLEELVEE
jgi:NAD(P)H-flavin reductase